ncbi:MCE family protein [Amycolatopsis silviterrae]|uniref:MCE family protein n=1 Tax=Amycolatopsis silviterrae TaxID=1656914 RepID=A0ABW5HJW5_9PSEU
MRRSNRVKDPLIGLAGLLSFALVVALCLAQYNQEFTSYVPATVRADRTGLLMDSGAKVKLNGVQVGTVGDIALSGSGVTVALRLYPDMAGKIPSGVEADLVPPTMFGAKYVSLVPEGSRSGTLQPNAVIPNRNYTAEINTTFDAVLRTLDALEPAQLNSMLNSVADTLQGRGKQIGSVLRETNDYLRQINPSLSSLAGDLPATSAVADDYTKVTPDLVRTLSNVGNLSDTMVREHAQLNAFLLSFTKLGNNTASFLSANERAIPTTLNYLRPTIQLLGRYSPEIPCLLGGLVRNDELLSAVVGGPEMGGTHRDAHVTVTVQSDSLPAYSYPGNLPVVGADNGPDCHGLPRVDRKVPYVNYDTGANPYPTHQDGLTVSQVPLSVLLFGEQQPTAGGGR